LLEGKTVERNKRRLKSWAAVFLVIAILIGIALVPQLNRYGKASAMASSENEFMYEKSIDVLVMLLIGFGFLMVFVRKYGYTSITATYILVSLSLPLYMLLRPYLWGSAANLSITNISMLLYAEFAAASLLIAVGVHLAELTLRNIYSSGYCSHLCTHSMSDFCLVECLFQLGFSWILLDLYTFILLELILHSEW
jgi:hypothetical protein